MLSALGLLLASQGSLFGDGIVVPSGNSHSEGDSVSDVIFGAGGPKRFQQVIASEAFTSIPGPLLIDSIALRADTPNGYGWVAHLTNEIRLSTTLRQPDSLSPVFAENVGPDETIVLPGDQGVDFLVNHMIEFSPQYFGSDINFTRPFLYNPQNGNLLLEIRNFGGMYEPFMPTVPILDAVNRSNDSISILYGASPGSSMGTLRTDGLVIAFGYTLVPEPSTVVLFGLGALSLAWLYRKRRR